MVMFCSLYDIGYGPMNDDIKKKISNSKIGSKHSYKTCEKISKSRLGFKPTIETRNKISKSNIGKKRSVEDCIKMSIACKGKPKPNGFNLHLSKPILQYNKNNEFIKEWSSVSDAARFLNKNSGAISECCLGKNNRKSIYGFIWKFK